MLFKLSKAAPVRDKGAKKRTAADEVDEIIAAVKLRMSTLNVKPPERPVDAKGEPLNPTLPPNLTVLNDAQLGHLHSKFACMAQWAQLHLAYIAVERAVWKTVEKKVRARVRLEKSGTVVDKEAKVEVDPRAKEAGFHALVAEGTEALTEGVMESYIIGRDACSREESRRSRTNFAGR